MRNAVRLLRVSRNRAAQVSVRLANIRLPERGKAAAALLLVKSGAGREDAAGSVSAPAAA